MKFEIHAFLFFPHQLSTNPGEGHQRPTDLFMLISVEVIVLQLFLLGVKFVFLFNRFFSFAFRFDFYKGCIVCVTFAYASLVSIHTEKIINKDKHFVVLIIIHTQTIKDIFMID